MSRRAQTPSGSAIVFGARPRAQLLPPEVEWQRREAGRRRGLLSLVVVVLLIVAAGISASVWYSSQATGQLEVSQAETERLLAEQLEYAEVVQLRSTLRSTEQTRAELAGVEVLWQEILLPYREILEADGRITALQLAGNIPGAEPLAPAGPLREPLSARVTMTIQTVTVPPADDWVRQLSALPTLADVSVDSITSDDDTAYTSTLTINLNDAALSERFGTAEGDE